MKQRPLDPALQRTLASLTHVWILDGLSQKTNWKVEDLVFQGGTSIALALGSPRFSEDLDFVAREDLALSPAMKKVARHVEEGLQQEYPGAQVDLKDKVKPDNPNAVFQFGVSLPGYIGKVHVKSEFWRVKPELVRGYEGGTRAIVARGAVKPILAVASPDQIFVDKIIALGGRERLKWRDLFDLWYLDMLADKPADKLLGNPALLKDRINHTLSLYTLDADRLRLGWSVLLERKPEEIVDLAQTDLKPWLPAHVWDRVWPHEVAKMVAGMREKLLSVYESWPTQSQHANREEIIAATAGLLGMNKEGTSISSQRFRP